MKRRPPPIPRRISRYRDFRNFLCVSPGVCYHPAPMRCPFCEADKESLKVIDSRTCDGGAAIRRRRECQKCSRRFTTYERIEPNMRLVVIKKDGSRVPFDRNKILSGLERACFKRPIEVGQMRRIVDEVEEEIQKLHDREVASSVIGELIIQRLRRLDQVAYVRFASVYRRFKTLDELVREAKAVIDTRHHDMPGQGRLFIEPPEDADARKTASKPSNGNPEHATDAAS
jgi:transcriptional repressor NrdR